MNRDKNKPSVIIIYGPTGVGKTDFALKIADRIRAEIINMDVGQLYTPLSIGTAKPDVSTVSVAHHGFDVFDKPKHFTVVAYRALCEQLIKDIRDRGNVPIIVGGSGFYLKSLFFPPRENDTTGHENDSGINENKIIGDEESSINLWQHLHTIDPIRAAHINPRDSYRVKRALAIWSKTGKKPSECKPYFDPISVQAAHIIFVGRDKQELYDRINKRVELMMDDGWLDEVSTLLDTPWESFIQQKKLIGYNELVDFLRVSNNRYHGKYMSSDNTFSKDEKKQMIVRNDNFAQVVKVIQQRTRHYAKRQCTFWRMFAALYASEQVHKKAAGMPTLLLESTNLTLFSSDLYINQLVATFKSFTKNNQK